MKTPKFAEGGIVHPKDGDDSTLFLVESGCPPYVLPKANQRHTEILKAINDGVSSEQP